MIKKVFVLLLYLNSTLPKIPENRQIGIQNAMNETKMNEQLSHKMLKIYIVSNLNNIFSRPIIALDLWLDYSSTGCQVVRLHFLQK